MRHAITEALSMLLLVLAVTLLVVLLIYGYNCLSMDVCEYSANKLLFMVPLSISLTALILSIKYRLEM